MEQKQFLTEDQINAILAIIEKDNINKQVDDAINIVLTSDEYATKLEEIKNSKDILDSINKENIKHQNRLKLYDLYKQISLIDINEIVPGWANQKNINYIEEIHKENLADIDKACENKTKSSIKLRGKWGIIQDIKEDLEARLLLTTPGTYQEIIDDMIQYINIDKYLRTV